MARRFTNNEGETVALSQQHLDRAIAIYQELEKLSPSRRVSWARLVKMMNAEGFDEAVHNESYRQVIKRERSKQNVLPNVETYANLVYDEKIDALKTEMGELYTKQVSAREDFNRLNRLKREYTRELLLLDVIKDKFYETDWGHFEEIEFEQDANAEPNKKMVITLNDLHYGYLRSVDENDIEQSEETLNRYLESVVKVGQRNNVSSIIVANLGDLIEGRLRDASLFDTRKTAVEQMVDATRLIQTFLVNLAKYFDVEYLAITGNHERTTSNYRQAVDGETYMTINKYAIEEMSNYIVGIDYIEADNDYNHILNVNGVNMYLCHGDRDKVKQATLLAELSTMHSVELDIVLAGHFHSHSVTEVGDDKYQVITGSLKGSDSFSDKINKRSSMSQVGIVVDGNGNFEILQIKL